MLNSDNTPVSPLTGERCDLIYTLDTARIIDLYMSHYEIDVASYFKEVEQVAVFECPKTGFRFYHPFGLAAKSEVYAALQKGEWPAYRWEFDKALEFIKNGQRVLDIGCSSGEFLDRCRSRYPSCTLAGIETSPTGLVAAKARDLDVSGELIQSFAEKNRNKFDVVCTFQVLEHIEDPKGFLQGCVAVLAKDGKLVIAVPNNDSFLGEDRYATLNLPPHHTGLWNERSLRALESILPLKLERIEFEPLNNVEWFVAVKERNFFSRAPIIGRAYYKSGLHEKFRQWIERSRERLRGVSVLAVYQRMN